MPEIKKILEIIWEEIPWWMWVVMIPLIILGFVIMCYHWRRKFCGVPMTVTLLLLPLCLATESNQMDECTPCIVAARQGNKVINTLVYYTQQPLECKQTVATCLNQDLMYHVCKGESGKYFCFKPEVPIRNNYTVWAGMARTKEPRRDNPEGGGHLYYLNSTTILRSASPAALWFDACVALGKIRGSSCGPPWRVNAYSWDHKYICYPHEGWNVGNPEKWAPCGSTSLCSGWGCVCGYTGGNYKWCPHISNFKKEKGNLVSMDIRRTHSSIQVYGFGIDGGGQDPITYITITRTEMRDGERKTHTWSVENAVDKLQQNSFKISEHAKNLFLDMAQSIATELGVTNCYVCGGTNMGEDWPWQAMEISSDFYNNMSLIGNVTKRTHSHNLTWTITSQIVGRVCFSQNGTIAVGDLTCLGTWEKGFWYSPSNISQPGKFNTTWFPYIYSAFSTMTAWHAPSNMYWICGSLAYEYLPPSWSGSCILGFIKPSFFLIPIRTQQYLAAPVYGPLNRRKCDDDTPFTGFPCKNPEDFTGNVWDSQRIVSIYGPASWADDGSWGYRIPIYMLNRLIRLQAVLDLAGQHITSALTAIAEVTDQLRTAVYQNRLALDYLLASENGVCGKFNLTNCCLKIDPVGKVVDQLATEIKQLTFNPSQEWKGTQWQWLDNLMPQTWLKALGTMLIAPMCIILLLLICVPCLLRFIQATIQRVVERTTAPKLIALIQEYESLPLDDSE